MKEQLEKRLNALKAEYETGQQQLRAVEERGAALREMLLRISGAIQVLEEEIGQAEAAQDETPAATPENGAPETAP